MPTGQPSSTSSSSKGSNDTWNLLSAAFTRFDRRVSLCSGDGVMLVLSTLMRVPVRVSLQSMTVFG